MRRIVAILSLCLLILSCQRRELDYTYNNSIDVLVMPDWSSLPTGAELPQYLKACFYPTDGGKVIERYVEPQGETVKVPIGEYNVVVYTWRINGNAQSVQFRGTDKFETIEAYTAELSSSANRATSYPIILQPDSYLYSWSSAGLPIHVTKSGMQENPVSKGDKATRVIVVTAPMVNRVIQYKVNLKIENHTSVASIEAHIKGTSGWYRLSGGDLSNTAYATNIEPYISEVVSDGAIANFSFFTFGFSPEMLASGDISIRIVTVNGDGKEQTYEIDMREDILAIDSGDKGEVTPDEKPPIVVEPTKPVDGGFKPPEVGDWDDGGTTDVEI